MRDGNNRIVIYFAGFLMGMLLVSLIMSRRAARDQANPDPWIEHNAEMVEAGAAPLPEAVHPSITQGLMIDYGLLPDEEGPEMRINRIFFDFFLILSAICATFFS